MMMLMTMTMMFFFVFLRFDGGLFFSSKILPKSLHHHVFDHLFLLLYHRRRRRSELDPNVVVRNVGPKGFLFGRLHGLSINAFDSLTALVVIKRVGRRTGRRCEQEKFGQANAAQHKRQPKQPLDLPWCVLLQHISTSFSS
jgi:hypothetical protein